eukprot:COSAG01_NODE_8176_length_2890_cov_24.337513_1_plen_74_part_10
MPRAGIALRPAIGSRGGGGSSDSTPAADVDPAKRLFDTLDSDHDMRLNESEIQDMIRAIKPAIDDAHCDELTQD